jgi:hypothetical protein
VPGASARPAQQTQWQRGEDEVQPTQSRSGIFRHNPKLPDEPAQFIGGVPVLILATGKHVEKALCGAGITPLLSS